MSIAEKTDQTTDDAVVSRAFQPERVTIRFPIEVWGTDLMGKDFTEAGRTESITRHGATIVIKRLLGPQDTVRIVRAGGKSEALARIVGQTGIHPDGNVYGINLQDPESQFWGIRFPPISENKRAVSRVLLQCRTCKAREVVYLDEIEAEVFETNNWLSRSCNHCSDWTRWSLAADDVKPGDDDVVTPAGEKPKTKAASGADKRKHRRLKMQTNGCIREPGVDETLVAVVDVSRGGIKFRTPKKYPVHKWVEIAVPFTRGAANIFVPARITWTKYGNPGDLHEYGLAYIKQSKEQLLEELSQVRGKPPKK